MVDSFVIFPAPVSSPHTRICSLPFQMQHFDNGAARRYRIRKGAEVEKKEPKRQGEQRNVIYFFAVLSFPTIRSNFLFLASDQERDD